MLIESPSESSDVDEIDLGQLRRLLGLSGDATLQDVNRALLTLRAMRIGKTTAWNEAVSSALDGELLREAFGYPEATDEELTSIFDELEQKLSATTSGVTLSSSTPSMMPRLRLLSAAVGEDGVAEASADSEAEEEDRIRRAMGISEADWQKAKAAESDVDPAFISQSQRSDAENEELLRRSMRISKDEWERMPKLGE